MELLLEMVNIDNIYKETMISDYVVWISFAAEVDSDTKHTKLVPQLNAYS
jgi:hypothetical protein